MYNVTRRIRSRSVFLRSTFHCVLLAAAIVVNADSLAGPSSSSTTPSPGVTGTAPSVNIGDNLTPVAPTSVIYDSSSSNSSYVLGAGDSISIKVYPQDKYSADGLVINQDGTITLAKLGTMTVSGMTLAQIGDIIKIKLTEYCINPDVTVRLVSMRPQVVYVSGGVVQPKAFDAHAASTVAKAITLAGGPTDKFMLEHVAIVRQSQVLTSNIYPLLIQGIDNGQNIPLQPGDLVVVPVNTQKVTLVGSVANPGTYPLEQRGTSAEGPMRLSDILSLAGGTEKRSVSKIGNVALLRSDGINKEPKVMHFDYGKFLSKGDIANNPVLQDNDIIVVPENRKPDISSLVSYTSLFYLLRGIIP